MAARRRPWSERWPTSATPVKLSPWHSPLGLCRSAAAAAALAEAARSSSSSPSSWTGPRRRKRPRRHASLRTKRWRLEDVSHRGTSAGGEAATRARQRCSSRPRRRHSRLTPETDARSRALRRSKIDRRRASSRRCIASEARGARETARPRGADDADDPDVPSAEDVACSVFSSASSASIPRHQCVDVSSSSLN